MEHPALTELRERLEQEERAYADVLAALDRLAAFTLPAEETLDEGEAMVRLNTLWSIPHPSPAGPLLGRLRRWIWGVLAPALDRQAAFNAALVQLLNARLAATDRLHAQLRELAAALVRYAQRVQPLVDAHARVGSALATTHSELLLESFGRQLESHARRIEELSASSRRGLP